MPDNDLVEQVASAIEIAICNSLVPGQSFNPLKVALAAIASIEAAGYVVVPQEPTDEMLDAGLFMGVDVTTSELTFYWRAMIDAALKKETISNA